MIRGGGGEDSALGWVEAGQSLSREKALPPPFDLPLPSPLLVMLLSPFLKSY